MKVTLSTRTGQGLEGFFLDTPADGAVNGDEPILLSGWVLGTQAAVQYVEATAAGTCFARIELDQPRPDIERAYPDISWAGGSGFQGWLPVLRLPSRFEVELTAVCSDGARRILAVLEGEWTPPVSVGPERLQPLMLTTLGRSGSTWVMRLLGQHPQVTSFAPFRYEPRLAAYWMEVYGGLTGPASVDQVLRGEVYGPDWWVGTHRGHTTPPTEGSMERWLARDHARALLPFALDRIEAFYREAVDRERKPEGVRFFTEKFSPHFWVQPFLASLFPAAREILLVRDPRDMVCSMLAFNRKRGVAEFGRSQVASDEAFARWWGHGVQQLLDTWRGRGPSAVLLRYEDLIQAPVPTLVHLFSALDIDASRDTVEEVLARAQGLTPGAQKLHQTASDPAASVGRWATDLEPAVRDAVQETFSGLLEAFGYSADPTVALV